MNPPRSRRVVVAVTATIIVVAVGVSLYGALSSGDNKPQSSANNWVGLWSGTIDQPDSPIHSWTFNMNLRESKGAIIGSYVELSLDCSGRLTTTFAGASRLELDEAVTAQPPAGTPWFCGGGPIQVKRTGAQSAIYSWEGGVASGVIRRHGGV